MLGLCVLLMLASPALGDGSWRFLPGLWEMTLTQDIPPNIQAYLQSHHMAAQKPKTQQVCMTPDKNDLSKSVFDPANEPAGACHEKVLSDDGGGRVIEDDCQIPDMAKLPPAPGGKNVQLPPKHGVSRRHVLKSGDGAGMVDVAEARVESNGAALVTNMRWLAAKCPAGMPP
jgi:hypothetical protein